MGGSHYKVYSTFDMFNELNEIIYLCPGLIHCSAVVLNKHSTSSLGGVLIKSIIICVQLVAGFAAGGVDAFSSSIAIMSVYRIFLSLFPYIVFLSG